jgi:phage baseplate assembly protein W
MTDFRGRGITFPLLPDAAGMLRYVEGDEEAAQSLRLLLMTAAGERVMRSGFGTQAPRLVFAPGSETNKTLLETSVREAVRDYEPRVEVADVVVTQSMLAPERIDVEVTYTVRRTNTRDSIVFPYYLSRPGGLP